MVFHFFSLSSCAAPPLRPPPLFFSDCEADLLSFLCTASPPRLRPTPLSVAATWFTRTGRGSFLPLGPSCRAVLSPSCRVVIAAAQGRVGFGLLRRASVVRAFISGGSWAGSVNPRAWVVGLGLATGWDVRGSFFVLGFSFRSVFPFRSRVLFSFIIFSVCVVCWSDMGLADRCTDLLVQDLSRVCWLWGFGWILCWFGLKGFASMPISVFESEWILSMVKCTTPILISGRGVRDFEPMKVLVRNYIILPDPLARGCIGQRYMSQEYLRMSFCVCNCSFVYVELVIGSVVFVLFDYDLLCKCRMAFY